MTRVYLVRHGETEWNATGRWQGFSDVPLNDVGRVQAQLVAQRVQHIDESFAAIYSSDLLRAWDTAVAIGNVLDLQPVAEPDLREIDIGWWGGLTREEIEARDTGFLARVDQGEDLPRGGAETMTDLYTRASAALERVGAKYAGSTVILVAHGGTVRALLEHARKNGAVTWPWTFDSIGNTSISIIEHTDGQWRILAINDMQHIAETPQAVDVLAPAPRDAQQV